VNNGGGFNPGLPPRGSGRPDFVAPLAIAEAYRRYADLVRTAPPSNRLDAFESVARRVAALVHPSDFPLAEAVDWLSTTAEANGLVFLHGDDAVQERLAAAFANPIVPTNEDAWRLDLESDKHRDETSSQPQQPGAGRSVNPFEGDNQPGRNGLGLHRSSSGSGKDGGGDDDLDVKLASLPQTDLGNAERFQERCRGRLLWSPVTGWLAWDGQRWRPDVSGRVRAAAHQTVRAIQQEAEALRGSGADRYVGTRHGQSIMLSDSLAAWGRASEHSARLSALVEQAEPYLYVAPHALDADPFKINVANGTLVVCRTTDGASIELQAHDPGDLITKLCPVVYDPNATCEVFDRFLAEVQPDADVRRTLLQWQGYSLTGDTSEQKLALFWGRGKNGKSSFVDICAYIGGDYSKTVPIETFLKDGRSRSAGQATPDLAMLPGVRHLRTSEPERGAKLAEALIKLVTGGEPILARHLRKEFFEFYPQCKLTISGNHRPKISGTDDGIWRRVIFIPWPIRIPKEKIDKHLSDKLRAEASGILNRLLAGLRDWLQNGLVLSAEVTRATAEYRADSDPVGRFLDECVISAFGKRVRVGAMQELYNAWARANGETERKGRGLATPLKEHGFVSKHSNGGWWLDVDLVKHVGDFRGDPEAGAEAISEGTSVDGDNDVVEL
jgi:putative DNA primase/helicase